MTITQPRRRRTPAEAEQEILASTRALLADKSAVELTVNDVMAGTSLSRAAFYRYFPSIHHATLRLLDDVGDELFEMSQRWLRGEGDPAADALAALEGLVDVFARDGRLLAKVAEARALDAPFDEAYRALLDRFISATTRRIRAEQKRGRTPPVNPAETATALILMTENYLRDRLGGRPRVPRRRAVDTLMAIWMGTLYPEVNWR